MNLELHHIADDVDTELSFEVGTITSVDTEAIVNAANSRLAGGAGVDAAIHRAGGPSIMDECRRIIGRIGSLQRGNAVITRGGDLFASFVIHTVGPVWLGGQNGEEEILARCYSNSLRLARDRGIRTIAFPAISTGAYGFPRERAAEIALRTCIEFAQQDNFFREICFVLHTDEDLDIYRQKLARFMASEQLSEEYV